MSNQCQGEIEVTSKERYSYAGGLHLDEMHSCFYSTFEAVKNWVGMQ